MGDDDTPAAAQYKVLKASMIREGFDMDSPKAGKLKKAALIDVVERRVNADGVVRVRFGEGWTSEQLKDGSVVLELVSGAAPALQPTSGGSSGGSAASASAPAAVASSQGGGGAQYKVLLASVIREGFDMDSPKAGTLTKKALIEVRSEAAAVVVVVVVAAVAITLLQTMVTTPILALTTTTTTITTVAFKGRRVDY